MERVSEREIMEIAGAVCKYTHVSVRVLSKHTHSHDPPQNVNPWPYSRRLL